jgi:hypothetical protein
MQKKDCMQSTEKQGAYYFLCVAKIPLTSEKTTAKYFVLAEAANAQGKKVFSFKRFEFSIGKKVFVRLYYPVEGESTVLEDKNMLVGIWVGNNLPLAKEKVEAKANEIPVTLFFDPNTRLYSADFDLANIGFGEQLLHLELLGDFEQDKEFFKVFLQEPELIQPNPNLQRNLAIAVIAIIAFFALVASVLSLKTRKKEKSAEKEKALKELDEKIAEAKKQVKQTRFEYMAGGLSESAFNVKIAGLRRSLKELEEKKTKL